MKKNLVVFCLCLLGSGFSAIAVAGNAAEINYLRNYGQRVLIHGTHTEENKWDWACRIKREVNYIAIVQNDGSNYRIIPAPRGQIIEKICPADVFADAIRWYENLQKASY